MQQKEMLALEKVNNVLACLCEDICDKICGDCIEINSTGEMVIDDERPRVSQEFSVYVENGRFKYDINVIVYLEWDNDLTAAGYKISWFDDPRLRTILRVIASFLGGCAFGKKDNTVRVWGTYYDAYVCIDITPRKDD